MDDPPRHPMIFTDQLNCWNYDLGCQLRSLRGGFLPETLRWFHVTTRSPVYHEQVPRTRVEVHLIYRHMTWKRLQRLDHIHRFFCSTKLRWNSESLKGSTFLAILCGRPTIFLTQRCYASTSRSATLAMEWFDWKILLPPQISLEYDIEKHHACLTMTLPWPISASSFVCFRKQLISTGSGVSFDRFVASVGCWEEIACLTVPILGGSGLVTHWYRSEGIPKLRLVWNGTFWFDVKGFGNPSPSHLDPWWPPVFEKNQCIDPILTNHISCTMQLHP